MEQVGDRMRKIKFRAWCENDKEMLRWEDMQLWGINSLNDGGLMKVMFIEYTGLKDKNGKEIYDGDIITAHSEYNTIESGIVKWDNKEASFRIEQGISVGTSFYGFQQIENIEVIGNIYENPELIK